MSLTVEWETFWDLIIIIMWVHKLTFKYSCPVIAIHFVPYLALKLYKCPTITKLSVHRQVSWTFECWTYPRFCIDKLHAVSNDFTPVLGRLIHHSLMRFMYVSNINCSNKKHFLYTNCWAIHNVDYKYKHTWAYLRTRNISFSCDTSSL